MPGNQDNTPHDQPSSTPTRNALDSTQTGAESVTKPAIDESDLLGIVEGTIDKDRLRAIREALVNDKELLSRLSRMKRDREQLQASESSERAPAGLVNAAMERAATTTMGFDTRSEFDAVPAWPSDHQEHAAMEPINPDAADDRDHAPHHPTHHPTHRPSHRVSPTAMRHRHRLGWKGRTALAAALVLVIGGAFAITAMLGALDPNRRPELPKRPWVELAESNDTEPQQTDPQPDYEREFMLKRAELTERLMEMIDESGAQAPELAELDLDAMLEAGPSIDEILLAIADDLILGDNWHAGAGQGSGQLVEANPVRHLVDTGRVDVALIGRLARSGQLHVSIETRDATETMIRLLQPDLSAPRHNESATGYAAELIAFAELDAMNWTGARPVVTPPDASAQAASSSWEMHSVEPESDPQMARVQALLHEIRERRQKAQADGEGTDPVYRVSFGDLGMLDPGAAGRLVMETLERVVGAGDRVSFYEVGSANAPDLPGADRPALRPSGAGFTVQVYVRERARIRR